MKVSLLLLPIMFALELWKPSQSPGAKAVAMCLFLANLGCVLLHIYFPDKPEEPALNKH